MAKSKLAGKKIQEEVSLGGGLTMIKFTDGTFIIVSTMTDTIDPEEIGFGSSEDSEEEEEEEEDEETDDDEEEDSDDEDDEEDDEDSEEEEEEEDLTAEDLLEMDFDDLEDVVDDYELEVDVDDFEDDEEGLRKAIAKELGIKLPAKAAKGKGKKK